MNINLKTNIKSLKKAENQALLAAQRIGSAVVRTARLVSYFAEAAGYIIDETTRIAIQAGGYIVEYAAAAVAASSWTPFGIGASLLRLGAVAALGFQIAALQSNRAESARQFGALEAGLDGVMMMVI